MAELVPLLSAEENNELSWYTAGAAGIASGILKVPEGIFSLAAELIDLGFDSDTAGKVEQFFDTINPFEERASEKAIGKITEAITQVASVGTLGWKLATKAFDKALKAKKCDENCVQFIESKNRKHVDYLLSKMQK